MHCCSGGGDLHDRGVGVANQIWSLIDGHHPPPFVAIPSLQSTSTTSFTIPMIIFIFSHYKIFLFIGGRPCAAGTCTCRSSARSSDDRQADRQGDRQDDCKSDCQGEWVSSQVQPTGHTAVLFNATGGPRAGAGPRIAEDIKKKHTFYPFGLNLTTIIII